jgi:hypothetical protein
MSLSDRLAALGNPENTETYNPRHALRQFKHPQGWEPGVVWDGKSGTAISKPIPADQPVDHAALLTEWGFDPTTHMILEGSLEYRQWDANVGGGEIKTLRYYKAKIVRGAQLPEADLKDLFDQIRKAKTPVRVPEVGDDAFCVFLADWQIGKGENGGTPATVERLLSAADAVEGRIKELRRLGRPLGSLYVFGLGDLLEGCSGWYDMQEWQVDLNRRDQFQTVVRLLVSMLRKWSRLFGRVIVSGIGGNHGENRKAGKAFTDFADNDDVSVFETAALVLNENPGAYGHVSFVIPNDRLSLVLDVAGTPVGVVHGHQFRSGPNATAKAEKWWKDHTFGLQPVADAVILVSGHFHHFAAMEFGHRVWMQAPAMDGGSQWWTEMTGSNSPAGMLTFRVTGQGWTDLAIVR